MKFGISGAPMELKKLNLLLPGLRAPAEFFAADGSPKL
jgi:hypothetical protein